jgi:hypothetical protein
MTSDFLLSVLLTRKVNTMPTFDEIRRQKTEKEAKKIQLEAEQRAKQARFEEESERRRKEEKVLDSKFEQAKAYYNDSPFPELLSLMAEHLNTLDNTYVQNEGSYKQEDGCHIDCCVTMYNEKVLNPVQTWLPGFSAICLYTTIGMASRRW